MHEPTAVAAPAGVNGNWPKRPAAVAAGRYHTLLLRQGVDAIAASNVEASLGKAGTAGGVFGCGRNACMQLGLPTLAVAVTRPTRISALDGLLGGDSVMSVSCGALHSVALSRHGRVFSWGNNSFGQLGVGVFSSQASAQDLSDGHRGLPPSTVEIDSDRQELAEIAHVACGSDHTVFLSVTGQAYAAGCNTYGQLGCTDVRAPSAGAMPSTGGAQGMICCEALPRLINAGGPRIRAVFAGADVTLCVPAAGRSVHELRTLELERLLNQSRGHVDILQIALDGATKTAVDVQTARQQAEQLAAASVEAQLETERRLQDAHERAAVAERESEAVSSERAAALAEAKAQRECLNEAEEKMRIMKEEHARAIETLEAQRAALEQGHQSALAAALEERDQASARPSPCVHKSSSSMRVAYLFLPALPPPPAPLLEE